MFNQQFPAGTGTRLARALTATCLLVAMAGTSGAMEVSTCALTALVIDRDPEGLNVRAGPSTDTIAIAKLPPPYEFKPYECKNECRTYEFATEVSVTGAKDGWFRVDRAVTFLDLLGGEIVFEDEGWISGRYLSLRLNSPNLRSGPSQGEPFVAEFMRDSSGDATEQDSFIVDRLLSCAGRWVEVEGTFRDTRWRGWTDDICTYQGISCP